MKIFMLVDYQNDFVSGSLGFPQAIELDSRIAQRIRQARLNRETIICTMDTHGDDYLQTQEGKKLPVPHCLYPSDGWQVFGESHKELEKSSALVPVHYVKKTTFGSGDLIRLLKDVAGNEPCEIEIGGVVTNMCVISNAVIAKAALPEANIVINSGLCASFDKHLHEAALAVMSSMQMTII